MDLKTSNAGRWLESFPHTRGDGPAILEWDNMTREEIIAFLQEYSDNALQEEPLDFIPQRADALLYLLDKTKQELAEDEQE